MDDETEAAINEKTAILYGEVERFQVALTQAKADVKDAREGLADATRELHRHCRGLRPMPLFEDAKP